jgi:hypothetical protein
MGDHITDSNMFHLVFYIKICSFLPFLLSSAKKGNNIPSCLFFFITGPVEKEEKEVKK